MRCSSRVVDTCINLAHSLCDLAPGFFVVDHCLRNDQTIGGLYTIVVVKMKSQSTCAAARRVPAAADSSCMAVGIELGPVLESLPADMVGASATCQEVGFERVAGAVTSRHNIAPEIPRSDTKIRTSCFRNWMSLFTNACRRTIRSSTWARRTQASP